MTNIVTCVEFFEAKAGCKDQLQSALIEIAVLSRKENGCIQYDVIEDKENDHLFVLVLMYQSSELMAKHEEQPYVLDFSENNMQRLCKEVKWYDGQKIF